MATVLQQAIEYIKAHEDNLTSKDILIYLDSWLPEEEQQIKDAWYAGNKRGEDQVNILTPEGNIYPDFETYLSNLKK